MGSEGEGNVRLSSQSPTAIVLSVVRNRDRVGFSLLNIEILTLVRVWSASTPTGMPYRPEPGIRHNFEPYEG